MNEELIYTDLDLQLQENIFTHDINVVKNKTDIKQSLKFLLNTQFYSRIWKPYLGNHLRSVLFLPNTNKTYNIIHDQIVEVIKKFEPRIMISDIEINSENDSKHNSVVIIKIMYMILNLNEKDELTIVFEKN